MAVKQILNLTEFSRGNEASWQQMSVPIPEGVLIYSLDEGKFKMGNGTDLYAVLPVLFTYDDLVTAKAGLATLFASFDGVTNDNEIVLVQGGKYAPSGTTLSSVLANLTTLETNNATQTTDFQTLRNILLKVDAASIGNAPANNLVTIAGGKYMDSGKTVDDAINEANAANNTLPGPHMEKVEWFTDVDCTNRLDKDAMRNGGSYYCKLTGFHDETASPVFDLTCDKVGVTITVTAEPTIYQVALANINPIADLSTPVIFHASIDDGTGNAKGIKPVVVQIQSMAILVSLYGGTGDDKFTGVAVDSNDNIIIAGFTNSEGQGGYDALVIKFDSSLNILARKIYGGAGTDYFRGVAVDSLDNIICSGLTASEGQGLNDALVVKFDSSLNILARKIYGGTGDGEFKGVVVDSNDNIICAGWTNSEGQGSQDALVVKFDNSLNILARKAYGGTGADVDYSVAVDSNDNIICAGWTNSEGPGSYSALVVKFDSALNILARKVYGGTANDWFGSIAVDSLDNIICAGYAGSEGQGLYDALVIKFDSSLNILARKIYGGTGDDWYNDITIDSNDNIICAGRLLSSAQGSNSAGFLVKFDSSLNILGSKFFGLSTDGYVNSVAVDSNDNIIVAGYATETTNVEAMVMKFPSDIPSGNYVSTAINTFSIIDDGSLTLADSALTLADSTLTLADSALTLADSVLTLANSNLTQEKDVII